MKTPISRLFLVTAGLTCLTAPADAVTITSQSSSAPFPGVTIVEGRTSSPNTDFYAAFISLSHRSR